VDAPRLADSPATHAATLGAADVADAPGGPVGLDVDPPRALGRAEAALRIVEVTRRWISRTCNR
jgi:hypothetical protein